MAELEVLTYGFALNTDQGSFGFSTISLLTVDNQRILVDTGPASRRALLVRALQNKDLSPDDIDTVVLTICTGITAKTPTYSETPEYWSTPRNTTTPATPTGGTWQWPGTSLT